MTFTPPEGTVDRPQGDRPLLDDLTIPELRVANGKLRGDCVEAIQRPTFDRWDALALVAWLWHKRLDPRARLDAWTALTAGELSQLLHLAGDPADDQAGDDQVDVDQGDDPDDGTDDDPWTDDPGRELAADPTATAL